MEKKWFMIDNICSFVYPVCALFSNICHKINFKGSKFYYSRPIFRWDQKQFLQSYLPERVLVPFNINQDSSKFIYLFIFFFSFRSGARKMNWYVKWTLPLLSMLPALLMTEEIFWWAMDLMFGKCVYTFTFICLCADLFLHNLNIEILW